MSAARVIAGHVTHDRVDGALVPGGSAWYGARAWRTLGRTPTLITTVGRDFAHDAALDGLGARVTRAGRTTVFANHYPTEGPRLMRCDAQAPPVTPPPDLRAELLVLAPVLGEIDRAAWSACRAKKLVLGLQGWIKRRGRDGTLGCRPADVPPATLHGVDAACLSDEDLDGYLPWLQWLVTKVPIVALTHGARGSTVFVEGHPHAVPTRRVEAPTPTGAGDTWLAVFADGLADGRPPLDAAAHASETTAAFLEASV